MKNLTTFVADKEIIINYAQSLNAGIDKKEIRIGIVFKGELKEFKAYTTNMIAYNVIPDNDTTDTYLPLYELIERQIIDEVAAWIQTVGSA